MATFSNDAVLLLRLLNVKGVGPAKVHFFVSWCGKEGIAFGQALNDAHITRDFFEPEQVDDFAATEERLLPTLIGFEESSVDLIGILDDRYPSNLLCRLGKLAPPVFMVKGAIDLLRAKSVGFCGSRKASEKGLFVASDCADQLSSAGINVTSGYAAGVDMAAHRAALASGGTTTLVLAEGIKHFKIKKDMEDVWDWTRVCVVSEFLPGIPWSARNAMRRNSTICALSNAVILIEAGLTGGSIAAGRECLKLKIPLFAPVYDGMPESAEGNRELLKDGAYPLKRKRDTQHANLKNVLKVIQNDPKCSTSSDGCSSSQLRLFSPTKHQSISK